MKITRKLFPFFFLLILASCTEDKDTGISRVNLNVSLDFEQSSLFTEEDADDSGYYRRFIAEVYREGAKSAVQRKVFVYNAVKHDGELFRLPVPLRVGKGEYRVVLWSDLILKKTDKDLFYNTSDLSGVSHIEPYQGNNVFKEALCGSSVLDIDSSGEINLDIPMHRALSPFRIAASDYDNFLAKYGKEVAENAEIRVTVPDSPASFDVSAAEPLAATREIHFNMGLSEAKETEDGLIIAGDYMFTGAADGSVEICLEIFDGAGNSLNKTENFAIVLKRGYITTIKGNFLTSENGLQIETSFKEDIVIDIDSTEPEM